MIAELAGEIERHAGASPASGPLETQIPRLCLLRATCPMPPKPVMRMVYKPALCLVAAGTKRGTFGSTILEYGPGHAGIVGVETPGSGRVVRASAERPFLGVVVEFDISLMRGVYDELPRRVASRDAAPGRTFVIEAGDDVVAAVLRLVRLLEKPEAIPILAPSLMRELSYWLLAGPRGGDIASAVLGAERSERLIAAVHEIRQRFSEPMPIDDLAQRIGMRASTFQRAFKAMMSMTPLQYQKQLRLLRARSLMLDEGLRAENAAYRVGYESASQFSREYARMFGAPPRRDTARVKASATSLAASSSL